MKNCFKAQRRMPLAAALAAVLVFTCGSAVAAVAIVQGTVGGADDGVPSVFAGVTVCFDLNGNGVCDPGEPATMTSATGRFKLSSPALAPLVAQIGARALNNGHAISGHYVFRANAAQVRAATKHPMLAATVNLTPLSTEIAGVIENQGLAVNTAIASLAQRMGVATASNLLLAPTQVAPGGDQAAILKESAIAQARIAADSQHR